LDKLGENLVLSNTIDSQKSFKLPYADFKFYFEGATVIFEKQNIFSLNQELEKLYVFTFNRTALKLEKEISLTQYFSSKNNYLRYQTKPFVAINHSMIYTVGSTKFRKSFLHNQSYLQIDFNKDFQPTSAELILHYPRKYTSGKELNIDTYLQAMNDSVVALGYKTFDSIYLYNLHQKQIVSKASFNEFSDYIEYDLSKTKDLAYRRWYEETNEKNRNMLVLKDKILIIKHLRKKEITDQSIFEYVLLDNNLKPIANNLFEHSISPSYCYRFKKGFIISNKELTKMYYYEVD
jgi:hypothetical protein